MTTVIAEARLSDPERFLLSCRAVFSVTCPKCKARPGERCQSTGGGNPMDVATHKVRSKRIEHWADEQVTRFAALVKAQGRTNWYDLPDGYYAESEAAATPMAEKPAKPLTPKGVRLTENQAEEIEGAVIRGGTAWASTAHFDGDAAHRQTVNALVDKGILDGGELSPDGYDRLYRLTVFGWQVYRHHRLVIRRLTPEEIDECEAAAVACGTAAKEDNS